MNQVKSMIDSEDKVLVILDSNHSYQHVTEELEAYSSLVTMGSYIVATDGIMREVADSPRAGENWLTDNPSNAAEDFVRSHPEFVLEDPSWNFNESELTKSLTHYPSAWLKRK